MKYQKFMPFSGQTVKFRLKNDPLMLHETYEGYNEKWFNSINSMAKKFYKSIEQWKKQENNIMEDIMVEGFKVINSAAIDEQEFNKFISLVKVSSKYLPNDLKYGDVRVTTKKELGKGSKSTAYYNSDNDSMSLIIDSNDPNPVLSFVHEIGHRVWYQKISSWNTKKELIDLYDSKDIKLFPTNYSKLDVEEFFAENFMYKRLGRKIDERVENLIEKIGY